MEEHYTGCQHSTPFVLNGPTQFFCGILQYTGDILVPCCMNSTISTPFLPQKTVAISFLADFSLNFYGLFVECECIHCFDSSLVLSFTNEAQISSPVTFMM
jgi:hypothetical protein